MTPNPFTYEIGVIAVSYGPRKLPLSPRLAGVLVKLVGGRWHWSDLGNTYKAAAQAVKRINELFRDLKIPYEIRTERPRGAGTGFYELRKKGAQQ